MRNGAVRLVLPLLLVLVGCGAPPVPRSLVDADVVGDKEAEVGVWLGPADTLHPHRASPHLVAALFTPLVATDPDTHLPAWGVDEPAALMQAISSADLRRWELQIKAGWRWHDGTPVVAGDLERGWRMAMAEGLPLASTISDVRARDATTLAFALTAPFAQVPQLLTHQTFVPLPPAAEADPAGFAAAPLGYGPLRIDTEAAGGPEVLRLDPVTRHPLTANGPVLVSLAASPGVEDDVVVGADGDILPPAGTADGSRTTLERTAGRQLAYLGLPLTDPAFADPDVRRALSAAIDREALASDLLQDAVVPADRLVGPGLARDPEVRCGACSRDADAAVAAWPTDPPALTIWYAAGADHEPVVRAVARDWSEVLGATDIQLASEPGEALLQRITSTGVDGPFRLSWQADVGAAVRVVEPLLGPRGSANDGRYRSDALAELLAAAAVERDVPTALKLYGAAESAALADMPLIPLWFSTIPVTARPDVTGTDLDGEGRMQLWRLDD